ncbi:MAG: helix-turn-helix domain-containing protein [Ruminococcus sp.]
MAIIEHAKYYSNEIYNVSHSHTSCELIYLTEGSLRIVTDKEEYTLHKNDMALIKSCQHHTITILSENTYCRYIAFINPWELKKQLVRPDLFAMLTDKSTSGMIYVKNVSNAQILFDEMTDIFLLHSNIYAELGTVLRLLSLFYRISKLEQIPVAHAGKRLAESVRVYIEEHFSENIRISDLAQRHFISPGYLTHVFKSETGMSPRAYLSHIRCTRAYDLILHTNMKFAEISDAVGFCCSNDMCRKLRDYYGLTPSEIRFGKSIS